MARTYTTERGVAIPTTTRESLQHIKGFLVPVYTETNPETGRQKYGLRPDDFRRVVSGHACPECLADFGGIYLAKCPACGHERDPVADVFTEPDYWKPDPQDPERNA